MKIRNLPVAMILVSVLAGCALPQPITWTPIPYDESEYNALPKSGTGVIRGQVFAKTVGGDVKKGAGNEVILVPATKYRNQWYSERYLLGHRALVNADPRHESLDRTKITDGEGRFEYADVPPGDYYVIGSVSWQTISDNPYSRRLGLMDTQGGTVIKRVSVADGKITEAMLSR